MDEWGLALTVIALVITALVAVAGVATIHGGMKEKVQTLETKAKESEVRHADAERRLARGDTQFALVAQSLKGVESSLDEIKEILTNTGKRRRRGEDEEDDDDN